MANRLQHLRGSEAEHSTFTGAKGEISLVTDTSANRIPTGEVRVHDGTTAGGLPLALGTTSKPLTNNIVLSSGVGINFNNYGSEDSNSATTVGSNLLDDYEEGTWTPTLPSASTATISNIYGNARYTKIGNIVHAYFNIKIGTNSDSNLLRVSLPFSSTNTQTGTTATEGVAILMYSTSTAARGNVYSAQNILTFQDANFTNRTYADASDTFLYAYVVYQSA
jgi:hypothetical protein